MVNIAPGVRRWIAPILVGLLSAFILAPDLRGQTPAPRQQPRQQQQDDTIRISTNLVQVDVVVTDGKGKHVTDLKPEDFILEVDGKQQPISFFQSVTLASPVSVSAERAAKDTPVGAVAGASQRTIRPEDVKRSIALVLDDQALEFDSFVRTREAIRMYIREQVQEGDLVSIIQTGRRFNNLQRFTTDRRAMLHAVEKLSWQPPTTGLAGLSDTDQTNSIAASAAFSDDFRIFDRFSALKFVSRSLRDLPGRKIAILFSDGFPIFMGVSLVDRIREVTDEAHRAGVAFYTFEAQGLTVPLPTETPIRMLPPGVPLGRIPPNTYQRQESDRRFRNREGLIYLARETGGLPIVGNNDIPKGLETFIRDNDSYYLLGFDPDDETFNGKFRSLKIKLQKRGLTARTRSGFVARPDAPKSNRPKTNSEVITDVIFSPFAPRDVPIELTALYFADAARKPLIRTMVQIDAAPLDFVVNENGKRTTTLELIAVTFNDNGKIEEQQERNFTVTLDEVAYQRVKRDGLVYQADFALSKPGQYQFYTVLREVSTGKMGASSQLLEVPNLAKGRLALSGMVLAGSTGDLNDSPTLRRFARGTEVNYGAIAYLPPRQTAASGAASGARQLYSQIEIYRDGKVVHQTPPRPVENNITAAGGDLDLGGRLTLGGLTPGDYHLRLLVSEVLADGKSDSAYQWMTFTVRE